jgi:transcriptional regulator GlxA family with amidase domain
VSVTRQALWYIESHPAGDLSLERIAAAVDVSPHEAFTRGFRQQFDTTPEQVRAHARVDDPPRQEPSE